jgi:small acid-soluble spore protein E (minor gamma-type SASP)
MGGEKMDTKKFTQGASKTNAQQVRAQNQASQQSPGGYQSEFASAAGVSANQAQAGATKQAQAGTANQAFQTEFASETNAQQIRQKNAQSMANKNKQ